jgi:hypothetical protein
MASRQLEAGRSGTEVRVPSARDSLSEYEDGCME